jgi:polysaccharide export outer membrane protein
MTPSPAGRCHDSRLPVPGAAFRFFSSVCLTLLLLAGCAGGAIPAARISKEGAAPEAVYRIGAGDALRIFVWRNEELTTNVVVRPDGKISMPLVSDMVAAGKTPVELEGDLNQVLGKYVNSPNVNVIVQSFVGTFADQIRVVGQAVHPKVVAYRTGMTVLDVMLEVGGLSEHASGNGSKVLRTVDGKSIQIAVRLNDLLYSGDVTQNIAMRPGDVVVVPLAWF